MGHEPPQRPKQANLHHARRGIGRNQTTWSERRRRKRRGANEFGTTATQARLWLKSALHRWPILPLMLALALISLTEFSARLLHQSQIATAGNEAMHLASDIRSRLESELNKMIYLTSGLASYVQIHANDLDPTEIDQLLASLHHNGDHLQNLGLAVGYTLRYVYPHEGNESAIGLDYRLIPDQLGDVQKVFSTRKPLMTPRIALVQGGYGVIYRSPIIVNGTVWGLLSTVIDIDQLLNSVLLDFDTSHIKFAVYDRNDSKTLLWGDTQVRNAPISKSLTTTSQWTVTVVPVLAPYQNMLGMSFRLLGYILAVLLAVGIHAIQKHRRDLLYLSRHDSLTGLANRRTFDDRLQLACARARRDKDIGFMVAIIDLNNFKPINDQLGHIVGDEVLKTVAQRLLTDTRATDLVSRWGGDEFGVLVECPEQRQMEPIQARLLTSIREPMIILGHELRVNASIGMVSAPNDGLSPNQLLSLADDRMYKNKSSSSNTLQESLTPA